MSKSDLDRAIKLASEWVAWFEAKGEADEPEQPHEADWARVIVAMAAVCDAVRLEIRAMSSWHRRERIGDPRLHRIFDALEAIDGTAAGAGVEIETEVVDVGPQDIGVLPAKAKRSRKKAAPRGEKARGR